MVTKFSPVDALRSAFGFVIPGWRCAWAALLLLAASNAALNFARIVTPRQGAWGWIAWFGQLGLLLAAATPAHGALARFRLKDRHPHDDTFRPGPGGLQWRKTETWLFAAALAYNLMFYAAFEAMQSLSLWPGVRGHFFAPAGGMTILAGAIWLSFLAIWAWVAVRLMAVVPAITERKHFVLFGAWPLTARAFWPMLPAFLIGYAAQVVPSLALEPITAAVTAAGLTGAQGQIDFAAGLVVGLIRAMTLPFAIGAAVYVYRTAVPSPEAAAVFD